MDKTIGILGGGQLGKMLLQYTSRLSLKTKVYDPSLNSPCKNLCDDFFIGGLNDYDKIIKFGLMCDIVTYEIEHINLDALKYIESMGIPVYPKSDTLEIIQDKSVQKSFFFKNKLDTSNFTYYNNINDIKSNFEDNNLKFPCVWKKTKFGYDGFGVKIIKNQNDINNLPEGECIIEDYVDIDKEISVIVARNISGDFKLYPPVEMIFDNDTNQVEYVFGPAELSNEHYDKVINLSKNVSECLNHVGILAIEMFLTKKGEVLVNELAPRPHNSGHITIEECCPTSQFEQHIRCILDLDLGETKFNQKAIMGNIVGDKGYSGDVKYIGLENLFKEEKTYLHIYGKKETRPNRKMGHFTIVGEDNLKNRAKVLKESIKVIV